MKKRKTNRWSYHRTTGAVWRSEDRPRLLQSGYGADRRAHGTHKISKASTSVKYWEIIADNLSKAGWSWGWVSALDVQGRTWIVDAHGYGKRFIVRADEIRTAFVELQRAIREFAVSLIS